MITKDMVEAADDRRCAVMLAADVAGMDALMADGMVWVHGSGALDDKASMIEKFGDGTMRYHDLKRSDYDVRLYGDTAVAMGVMDIDGQVGDLRKTLRNRFISVWVAGGADGLRLAAWQSMRTG